ncbi:MAG: hypothetical protein Q9N68_00960 [Gammaproteobacteria bacterium]|nr:hypothetical protein [Gammaproteobacteria bacterium]
MIKKQTMPKYGSSALSLFLLMLLLFLLSGCSNEYAEDLQKRHSFVGSQLNSLANKLDQGRLSNALLIKHYAKKLRQQKPELDEIIGQLEKDATSRGPNFQSLKQRLSALKLNPDNKSQYLPAAQELDALTAASDPLIYNDSLQDVVNTLADLSSGTLPRVNVPKQATSNTVAGSPLVGNPNYGSWVSNSNGGGFWQWYGQYRLLSDVVGLFGSRQRIGYDNWNRSRHNSYYNDWGRGAYGTAGDRQRWDRGQQQLANKGIKTPKAKRYGSVNSQQRISTYSSMQKRNSRIRKSTTGPVSLSGKPSSGNSSSSTKRTSSFFGASTRGSSSSRSRFGGK